MTRLVITMVVEVNTNHISPYELDKEIKDNKPELIERAVNAFRDGWQNGLKFENAKVISIAKSI